MDVLKQPQQHY